MSFVRNKIAFYSAFRDIVADFCNKNSIKGERNQYSDFI